VWRPVTAADAPAITTLLERMSARDHPTWSESREEVAEGVRIEPFEPRWSESTRIAKNAAFAEHWGSQPASREQWESMIGLPNVRWHTSTVARSRVGDGPADHSDGGISPCAPRAGGAGC
jgi:hypothetical protein